MPVAVALEEEPKGAVRFGDATILGDVGQQRDLRAFRALRERPFQRPKATAEGDVRLLCQVRLREHQHGVPMEGIFDAARLVVGERA